MGYGIGDLASLRGLAVNPAASASMLMRLATSPQRDSSVPHALLDREHLTPAVAAALAGHGDAQVRRRVAAHPSTPDEVRRVLAEDPEPMTRAEVALWPASWVDFPRPHPVTAAPLPFEVYRVLAVDPEPAVRAAVGRNRHVPEAVRVVLAGDLDPEVRRCAALDALPISLLHKLLQDPDRSVRHAALVTAIVHAPTATIPLEVAELIRDDGSVFSGLALQIVELSPELVERLWGLPDLREPLARNPSLPVERMAALLQDTEVRAALAGNPRLPASLVAELVATRDPEVHRELLMRTDLPDELRRSLIAASEDGEPLPNVVWLLPGYASLAERLSYLDHPNVAFRRTLALGNDLPAHAVERLANDPDFYTRLLICERYTDVPPATVAEVVERWHGHTRETLLRHPRLDADAVARHAASDSPSDRAAIASRPDLPGSLVLQLVVDPATAVSQAATANPNLPPARLSQLLTGPDPQLRRAAASNPALTIAEMEHLLTGI